MESSNQWNQALHDGVIKSKAKVKTDADTSIGEVLISKKTINTKKTSGDLELTLYTKTGLGDGQQANNPWLQELPDPITRTTWDNYITISATDATRLGIENNNPKYTFGMPFTNQQISFDPLKSLGRFGLNKAMSGGMTGIMGPAALLGGAVMLGRAFDPMRPGSRNYSPNLRGQVDYLSGISGMIGRNPDSGLMQYGPGSVLRGQNVSSMFGTNNYQTQLQNKIDWFEDRIDKGKNCW